jgi:hypothetical protein
MEQVVVHFRIFEQEMSLYKIEILASFSLFCTRKILNRNEKAVDGMVKKVNKNFN